MTTSFSDQYKSEMAEIAKRIAPLKVEVPAGASGDWIVEKFDVPFEPTMHLLREWRDGRPVPGGTYTRLKNSRESCFMSDTPAEMNDARELIWNGSGDILITGLGLGMLPRILLRDDLRLILRSRMRPITSITVVELEQDVINLVAPHISDDPRLKIVHGDAYTWEPEKRGKQFDWVWHDIWPNAPCEDDVDDIKRLRRHYARFMRMGNRQLVWLEEGIR